MVKQTRKAKPSPVFYGALVAVLVGGVIALGVMANKGRNVATTTVDPNLPPLKGEGYLIGKADAPVQVIEFGDFECPGCGQFATVTEPDVRERLVKTGIVAFRYFDFPLGMHPNTWPASHAAACANEQGKFWEMHDRIYAGQDEWWAQTTSSPQKVFARYAEQLGLNVDQFEKCVDDEKYKRQIQANREAGEQRMVPSTPTFIIGKRMVSGAIGYDQFKALVDSALAEAKRDSAAGTKAAPAAKSGA